MAGVEYSTEIICLQPRFILFQLRLKDKHCGDEFVHEFEDGTKRMEQYIKVRILDDTRILAWMAILEKMKP